MPYVKLVSRFDAMSVRIASGDAAITVKFVLIILSDLTCDRSHHHLDRLVVSEMIQSCSCNKLSYSSATNAGLFGIIFPSGVMIA